MILADTSVWIDHLRSGDPMLTGLLETARVSTHAFVIGELACGDLKRRGEILALLQDLPQTDVASGDEVLFFIERHQLMGLGIGYVDAHLLAGTFLAPGTRLWTRDKRLHGVAQRLGLAFAARD